MTTVALIVLSLVPYPVLDTAPIAEASVASPVQIRKLTTANPQGARIDTGVAALGINATSTSGTLTSVKVTLTDSGSSGFTPTSTLAALSANAFSGVSVYQDSATGTNGQFDLNDTLLSTTTVPVVQGGGPWTVTWTLQNAIASTTDTGDAQGDDFFVVVRAKESAAAVGQKFTVGIAAAADVVATNGNVGPAAAVTSDPLVVVPNLVISEMKVGIGGNPDDEFIELYNRSNVSYSATTTALTLHIRDAGGTDQARTLTTYKATIPAFGYYLIAGSGYVAQPGRDADAVYDTATTTTNKLVPDGAVYISTSATTAGLATTSMNVIDFLGWGQQPYGGSETATSTIALINNGNSYERKATSTDTTAAQMASGGTAEFKGNAFDSDHNGNDFVVQANPNPQNSTSPSEAPGNVADTNAPTVSGIFPGSGQTNVPTDISYIGFNFSKPMDASTITSANITFSGGSGTITYSSFPSFGEPQGKFVPALRPLGSGTAYTFTITRGVTDLAGNPLTATSTTTFSTGSGTQANTIPPFVTGATPMSGASNIPTNMAKMVVLFNQPLDSTTVTSATVQLWKMASGVGTQQSLSSIALDSTGKSVSFVPPALTASSNYEIRIVGGAGGVKSSSGIPMMGDPSGVAFRANFITGTSADLTPPRIIGAIPATGATGVPPGAIDVMFMFDDYMDPATIATTSVTLKDANNNLVAGTVTYLPESKEGHFFANSVLPLGATLTLTASSSATGIRNVVATSTPSAYTQLDGDSNGTGGDNYTYSFSTAASNADVTGPSIVNASANDFELSITFNDFVNSTNATDFDNWSLTVGGSAMTLSSLGGHTLTYDAFRKTVKIKGIKLVSGTAFSVTASNMRDVSGNLTAASSFSGTVFSAMSMAFTGPGEGSASMGTFGGGGQSFTSSGIGFMPSASVKPFSSFKSATTIYSFDIPITKQIPQNGTIVITFPSGYEASSISGAKKDTYSPANLDINGPGPSGSATSTKIGFSTSATGDTTAATQGGTASDGVTVDTDAKTVTITLDNAMRSENSDTHDFLHFDIGGIVNPAVAKDTSTGGYVLDIKTKNTSGTLLETVTPSALYIIGGGSITLRGKIHPSWANANANDGTPATAGLNGITVYLDAPGLGRISTTTAAKSFSADAVTNGRFEFSGLSSSTMIMVSTDALLNPTGTSTPYIGQTPKQVNLDFVLNTTQCTGTTCTQHISLTPTDKAGLTTVAVKLVNSANTFGASENIDIFAGGPGGFTATTTTPGTGARTSAATYVAMPVLQNGDWFIGMGPEMPKGDKMQMGPPPSASWIMPAPQKVSVTGCPTACTATPNSVTFTLSNSTDQIVGTVVDGSGNGVASAMVFAYTPFKTNDAGTQERGFGTSASTDSTGKFILKVVKGTYTMGAFSPGMPPSIEIPVVVNSSGVFANGSNTATTNVLVKLVKPPYKIPGKVVDSSNNPISGASVFAYRTDGPGHSQSPTDSSGNFTLYVNNGTWTVEAFLPQYGKITVQSGLTIAGADASSLTVTPGLLNTITGRVWKDNDGNATYDSGADTAVSNAQIRAFGANGVNQAWTDSNGSYTLRVPAGSYTLSGFVPELGELAPKTGVNASSGDVSGQNFIVKPPALVTVNIKDSSGSFVTVKRAFIDFFNTDSKFGNHVEITNGTSTTVYLPADATSGTVYKVFSYIEGVPQSAISMQSDSGATVIATTTQTVTVNGAETIKLVVSSNLISVAGTAYKNAAASGNELGEAWVEVVDSETGTHFGTMTTSAGTYSISLIAGTYSLQVMKPGMLPSPKTLTVSSAGAVTLDGTSVGASAVNIIATEGTLKISGTVTVGGAVPSDIQAFVRGEKKGGGYAGAKVNSDGTYDLYVTAGEWTITVAVDGYQETTRSGTVTVGSSSVTGKDINISSSATVSLTKSTTVAIDSTGNAIVIDEGITDGASMKLTFPEKSISSTDQAATVEIKETNRVTKTGAGVPIANRSKEVTIKTGSGTSASKVSTLNSAATMEMTYPKSTLVTEGVTTKTKADKLKLAKWSENALEWTALPTTIIYQDSSNAVVTPEENLSNVAFIIYKGTTDSFSPGGTINPEVGDAVAPSTPSSAPTVTAGNNKVDLAWSTYSDTNSQTVSSYRVYRETLSNGAFTTVLGSTTVKSYTDTTAVNGTAYYYKFAALDSDSDESDNSPISASVTPVNTVGGSAQASSGSAPAAAPTPTPSPTPVATSTPSVTPTSPAPSSTPVSQTTPTATAPSTAKPIKITEGALVRAEGDTKVYVLTHGVKQLIKSADEFKKRGLDWAKVQVVSGADVAALGDTLLVRAKGDTKVYVVKNGVKRWIRNGTIFAKSGYSFKDVVEVGKNEIALYPDTGTIRASDGKVYLVSAGVRRWVTSAKTFAKLKLKWEEVQEVSVTERNAYPEGKPY